VKTAAKFSAGAMAEEKKTASDWQAFLRPVQWLAGTNLQPARARRMFSQDGGATIMLGAAAGCGTRAGVNSRSDWEQGHDSAPDRGQGNSVRH